MIGQLADGVIAFAVGSAGLFGGKTLHGSVAGDEPVLCIVRGAELLEQNTF